MRVHVTHWAPADAPAGASDRPAEPAVFVHGLGGESLDWADLAAELAGSLDCYAIDLPGFGLSPPPSDHDVSIDAQAHAVVTAIGGIARDRVHVVGNSLGGAIATRVAAERPDLLRSLVLISPALPDLRPRVWSWQLLVALTPLLGERIVRRALRDPERLARQVFALCYGDPHAVGEQRFSQEVEGIRRRAALAHGPAVYRASLRALVSAYLQRGGRNLWRQAGLIDVPTLLIYGGRDKLVDVRTAARAQAAFRNCWLVRIPEVGHVAHLERPAVVAGWLRYFLDRLGEWPGAVAPLRAEVSLATRR